MNPTETKSFGDILATYRKEARFSLEEFAEQLRQIPQVVANWELGETLPNKRESVEQIAQVLKLDDEKTNYLLKVSGFDLSLKFWYLPLHRNIMFTGREELLQQLHHSLKKGKIDAETNFQTLSGLSGVGKTQIAIEYAYRYRQDYFAVLWLQANNREVLFSELVEFANVLGLPEYYSKNQNLVLNAVKIWLKVHKEWLIILDNVENIRLIEDIFPLNYSGHVLIIGDRTKSRFRLNTIELDTMTEQDGTLFLLRRSNKHFLEEAPFKQIEEKLYTQTKQLWELMDGLPLALELAGAFILETGYEIAAYCELYQKRRATWLRRRGFPPGYSESAFTAIVLAIEKVKQTDRFSLELLRLCAFLQPDSIPIEFFIKGAKHLGPILSEVVTDSTKLEGAITILSNYSLIQYDTTSQTLCLHRLVQNVLRETLKAELIQPWADFVVPALATTIPDLNDQTWWLYERYLLHARKCIDLINERSMNNKHVADLLDKCGSYLFQSARYNETELFYSMALKVNLDRFGDQHPLVAWSLEDLGDVYTELDNFSLAETYYHRAISIWHWYQINYSDDGVMTKEKIILNEIKVAKKLALVLVKDGKHNDAEMLYNNLIKQNLGSDRLEVEYNLATLYSEQGKYAEAEPLYQHALQIREQQFGSDHPEVAFMLNGLANLYRLQGKYAEAETLYQHALQIREQQLGSDHPDVSDTLYGLALLHSHQGKYAEAETLYQHALQIREQQLGSDDLSIASPLNGLVGLFCEQGKYAEAEPLYQRVLAIFERTLGTKHPTTEAAHKNYAILLRNLGRGAEAKQLEEDLR